jgi:hypothetical protein
VNNVNRRIEANEIVSVAAQNRCTVLARGDHNGRVDDIRRLGARAAGTREPRHFEVKWFDDGAGRAHESCDMRLASSVAAHLCYHACWNDDRGAVERRDPAKRQYLSVAFLDRDQCASIENDCACSCSRAPLSPAS